MMSSMSGLSSKHFKDLRQAHSCLEGSLATLDGDGTLAYHANALTSSSNFTISLRIIEAISFEASQEIKQSRTALLSIKTTN